MAIPATFILSILSKNLLLVLSTPEIASQGYLITPIVAIGGIFYGLYGIVTQIIVLENKTKLTGNIWIIAAVFNLVLAIILGYIFGIIGVAITTLSAYVFAFVLTSHFAFKYIRCNFYYAFISKAVSSSIIITVILLLINPHGLIFHSFNNGTIVYNLFDNNVNCQRDKNVRIILHLGYINGFV